MATLAELGEINKQHQEVCKAIPVRRIAEGVRKMPLRNKVALGYYTYKAVKGAKKASDYVDASVIGTRLPGSMLRRYGKEVRGMERTIARRERSGKYVPIGNNVYYKRRKILPKLADIGAAEVAAANTGGTRVYVKGAHRRGSTLGTTRAHPRYDKALMELNAGYLPTKWGKLKSRYVAAHEAQHVKDLAGTGRQVREVMDASNSAAIAFPSAGVLRDLRSGKGLSRLGEFGVIRRGQVGTTEGLADAAASARLKVPANAVSGYPTTARDSPIFGRGYVEGGGRPAPEGSAARRAARRRFRRVAQGRTAPRWANP